jgi:hypothetical protein
MVLSNLLKKANLCQWLLKIIFAQVITINDFFKVSYFNGAYTWYFSLMILFWSLRLIK